MNLKIVVPILFIFFFQTIIFSSKLDSISKPSSDNPRFLQTPDNTFMMESKIENNNPCSGFYNFCTKSIPTHRLKNFLIYPSKTMFQEFILPYLNSEKLNKLYTFFHSKNKAISAYEFFPPPRFSNVHTVVDVKKLTEDVKYLAEEYKFLYHFGSSFAHFMPYLYDEKTKTIEIINKNHPRVVWHYIFSTRDPEKSFSDFPENCVVVKSDDQFFPTRLETKAFGDTNQTVLIATALVTRCLKDFFVILADKQNLNSPRYTLICHGHFYKQSEKYVILYESSDENFQHENIEYPRDLKYILKAKYMSKCKKLFFKFHYGHFKLFQWILEKKCRFCEKILTKCLENYDGDDFYINEDQSCKKIFCQ